MQLKSILLFAVFSIGTSIAIAAPALAQDKESPFHGLMLRGRALAVIPQSSADISRIGGDTELSNSYVPELDVKKALPQHGCKPEQRRHHRRRRYQSLDCRRGCRI